MQRLTLIVEHSAALVLDRAATFVERKIGEADAAITDAAEHEAALQRLPLVGGHGHQAAILLLELVANELDRLHLSLSVERDRREQEAEPDRERLARRLPPGEAA